MEERVDYYPTGKFLQFRGDVTITHCIVNDRLIAVSYKGDDLVLAITPLDDKEGEIVKSNNWVRIPDVFRYKIMRYGFAGDKLLATLFSDNPLESLILVVHLDRNDQYQGPLGPKLENQALASLY